MQSMLNIRYLLIILWSDNLYFVLFLFFETESHYIALSVLELNYVDQASFELIGNFPPTGIKSVCHHVQLWKLVKFLYMKIVY